MKETTPDWIKADNEALLSFWGFGVNRSLPIIEDATEVAARTAEDIARRICAFAYVVIVGFAVPQLFESYDQVRH
jgi:hypothetical protein